MTPDISTVPGWTEKTDQEILDYLITPDPKRLPESQARKGTDYLHDLFGNPVQVETLIATLRTAGLNETANTLNARGLDFGNPVLQTQLDQLGVAFPDVFTADVVAALKGIGVDSRSPWQRQHGIDSLNPTLAEVTAARTQRELIDWYHARSEYVKDLVTNGTVTTQQAAAASLLTDVE